MKNFQRSIVELNAHLINLLEPNAMLTCNCSPELNTKGENIGAKGFRTLKLTLRGALPGPRPNRQLFA